MRPVIRHSTEAGDHLRGGHAMNQAIYAVPNDHHVCCSFFTYKITPQLCTGRQRKFTHLGGPGPLYHYTAAGSWQPLGRHLLQSSHLSHTCTSPKPLFSVRQQNRVLQTLGCLPPTFSRPARFDHSQACIHICFKTELSITAK